MATETQIRAALAWETGTEQPPEKNVWEWLWEAIQGDFNDNRTTGQPVQKMLDAIIHRLEMEHLVQRSGILDAKNMHFRGTLPEAQAVTLMRTTKPRPSWMSEGKAGKWAEQDLTDGLRDVAKQRKLDPHFPTLTDGNIKSFHKMAPDVIKGPAKLYRVTSPGNGAMGDCWFSEEVWKKLQSAPDPKSA